MKAIRVNIYRNKDFGDCSNHGISERHNDVLLLADDGFIEIDMSNPPENLCILTQKRIFGKVYTFVRPYAEPEGAGWMYGGTMIYSSDSRFPAETPLLLYDRQE